MPTLTVREATRRDWLRMRRVDQRRATLTAPWLDVHHMNEMRHNLTSAITGFSPASDRLVADVDGEVCAFVMFERGDERFRWYVTEMGAGSPRVDATEDVAVELWIALLEEGIRRAGSAGARRLFAFAHPDTSEYEGLQEAGFSGFANYFVLRGVPRRDPSMLPVLRSQHESDLWSIHQLYNHSTPRGVQFAEALTSDYWSVPEGSRVPFNRATVVGYVVPQEDGLGATCHISARGKRPIVTFLCDESLADSISSIIAAALLREGIGRDVDIIVPGYLHHLMSQFLAQGFSVIDERIGTVRHTTAPAVVESSTAPSMALREARTAATVPYRSLNTTGDESLMRDGA